MNLLDLERHVRAVKEFEWCGQKVHFRKLNAADHLALFGKLKPVEGGKADREATTDFHVEIVARSWADENGELVADSEEGRAMLGRVGFHDLVALGKLALDFNGYGDDEKKSTVETKCSPIDSAETLDPRSSTPTTSSPA